MARNILFILFVMCFSCKENFVPEKTYLDESGKIIRERYYPEGSIKSKSTYSMDTVLNGEHILYHKNGKIKLICDYKEGEITGIFKQYYENGTMEAEAVYYEGKREGATRFFHPNERLSSYTQYYNDNPVGGAFWYSPNGTPNDYEFYDSLGFKKYGCKYDSITGSVKHEEGSFMLNYSMDKGEIDPNEAITVNICTVDPPSLKIDAALCNLNSDGDSIVSGSASYPSVQEGNCYTFEKVYKEEGFYKFALVLKITNELTGEVYPKVLREHDWAVNVWE